MTWFAIYQTEDGRLVSGTGDPAKVADAGVLTARGYTVKQFADGAQAGQWNQATLQFDTAPVQAVFVDPDDFLDQFSAAELQRWYTSNSAVALKLLRVLQVRARSINLLGGKVLKILNGMTAAGFWDDQAGVGGAATTRPATILAYRPTSDI